MKFELRSYKLMLSTALLIGIFFYTCKPPKKNSPDVTIWELSDPDMLNPYNYNSANAGYVMGNIFQELIGMNPKTLELDGVLAEGRPEIIKRPDGVLLLTYNLRPEAKWDNGQSITAKDVVFSLKVMKNPKINNQRLRPGVDLFNDIITYTDDSLKLTFICKETYILAEASSGGIHILPEYIYDPKGLMKEFTIKELSDNPDKFSENPKIVEFANDFNSEKYQREKDYVRGSGAYELEQWVTGQKVILKRKQNWWGDQVKTNRNISFDNYPPKIIYQTINDQTTAIVALKAGNLDVMHSIKNKDFVELPKSEKVVKNFNLHTPMSFVYTYLGLNTRLPKFSDKQVRQALAHLVDVDKIIKTIQYNNATRTIGPIHPADVKEYNTAIEPYSYDVELARKMLTEAGWKDSNGNGTIDKEIDGELQEFTINFTFNSGNDERKAVALMFQEEARKVGIKVDVIPQDWSVYIDNQVKHNFEMYYGAWIGAPLPDDHKQIYHTESYNGGSNYTGFGNDLSDALIDSMRVELDEDKRTEMTKRFQVILHNEAAYIYLFAPKEKIAIHNRFKNAEPSVVRPGYREAGFMLDDKQ